MLSDWWLPELNPSLSQGDIIRVLPVWIPAPALVSLEKRTFPNHPEHPTPAEKRTAWAESLESETDDSGYGHYLARARSYVAIVLTHDCQLDKKKTKRARVQLAATADLDGLNAEERTKVINQGTLAQLILPDIPQVGTYYADLRIIFTVDKGLIIDSMRTASMSEKAKVRLQNQIIAYFTDRQRPTAATNS